MIKRIAPVAVLVVLAVAAPAHASSSAFANCKTVNQTYPHGVGKAKAHDHVSSGKPVTNFTKSDAKYAQAIKANPNLDRDNDKIACEKH